MKIGIDYHGVIDAVPEFFAILTQLLIKAGHEVHIITGTKDSPKFRKKLKSLGIKFTHLFSISSYHEKRGTKVWYADKNKNNPWMDADAWNKTKAHYCEQNSIDYHFDDTEKYATYFNTPFLLFKKMK